MNPVILLPFIIAIIITYSALFASKGSIVILENPDGTGFTIDLNKWSSKDKCELSLNSGDVLQISVDRKDGKIALTVGGKNGSEPYTGNDLESGLFTVRVSETDRYEIRIAGNGATGKVIVKNLKSADKQE